MRLLNIHPLGPGEPGHLGERILQRKLLLTVEQTTAHADDESENCKANHHHEDGCGGEEGEDVADPTDESCEQTGKLRDHVSHCESSCLSFKCEW